MVCVLLERVGEARRIDAKCAEPLLRPHLEVPIEEEEKCDDTKSERTGSRGSPLEVANGNGRDRSQERYANERDFTDVNRKPSEHAEREARTHHEQNAQATFTCRGLVGQHGPRTEEAANGERDEGTPGK